MIKKIIIFILLLVSCFFSGYFIGIYKPELIFKKYGKKNIEGTVTKKSVKSGSDKKTVQKKTETVKTLSTENKKADKDIIQDVIKQNR